MLDCKNILVKKYALHLSGREIAEELGCGKTYLAKALGVAACRSFRVEYRHCDSLLYELEDLKRRNFPKFEKRLRRLALIDVLVVDDSLVTPTSEDTESSIMFQILERRTEARKTPSCARSEIQTAGPRCSQATR